MSLVSVKNLTFVPQGASEPALDNLSLSLPRGSRTLLIGANGAGKSTLLQILAGKRLIKGADVTIKGLDVFYQFPEGVTFLGTEWAMNPVVRSDILVSHFLDSVGGYRYKERRDLLLDLLDIDLDWHMHNISDGERRRVQLCMGLMAPWDVLLLDEVTVDLDVLVRHQLLEFLKNDSEARGATIIYATHIFDGLNDFPTHVSHLHLGAFIQPPTPWNTGDVSRGSLYDIALQWLTEDRAHRRQLELEGRKMRGARRNAVCDFAPMFAARLTGHSFLPYVAGCAERLRDLLQEIRLLALSRFQPCIFVDVPQITVIDLFPAPSKLVILSHS